MLIDSEEEINLLYLQGPHILAEAIRVRKVARTKEVTQIIIDLGDPMVAYCFAANTKLSRYIIDKLRTISCKDHNYSYNFAINIDLEPKEETRQGACKCSRTAYYYARYVDRKPTEETRQAACKDPRWASRYIEDFGY